MSGFYDPSAGRAFGTGRDIKPNTGSDTLGMEQNGFNTDRHSSPSSNPHAGFHPSSFGQGSSYAAVALGVPSSGGSSLGMSISPPHWVPGNAPWASSGSYVGSFGALGTSFGRERDRELEAKYVRDFTCCGRQLNGLHDLLEHYEEEHANLPPDARIAAINAAQAGSSSGGAISFSLPPRPVQQSDVPTPPGMMDIEMEESIQPTPADLLSSRAQPARPMYSSAPASPWATAFRPHGTSTPPQCLPPSLLSYTPPLQPDLAALTTEQLQAKAMRRAQKKAERAAYREEASVSDAEGDKRFPCPIEGCGKVYKQANGLKYHLTRSINSGHGNVAAIGGLAQFLD